MTFNKEIIDKLWNEVILSFKNKYNFDLSYMKYELSNIPYYTNGKPDKSSDPKKSGGTWTWYHKVYINEDPVSVMKKYGVSKNPTKKEIENFVKMIMAHELAHEIWSRKASLQFKKEIVSKAKVEKFTTPYLKTVLKDKYDKECFCEYLASKIVK